jgi:hypothetical protein
MNPNEIKNKTVRQIWKQALWSSRMGRQSVFLTVGIVFASVAAVFLTVLLLADGLDDNAKWGLGTAVGISLIYCFLFLGLFIKKPKTIFAADDMSVYFAWANSPYTTWFEDDYLNFKNYSYKDAGDRATIKIAFKEKSYAGGFHGYIKRLSLYRVENPKKLKALLDSKGVPCEK